MKSVQIIIRGRQFNVRTTDGDSIQRRAKELDRRLTEQYERSRSFDEHSILMITALNILNELNLLKQQHSEQLQELDKDLESTIALIDALLPSNKKSVDVTET
ncbi:MAG: cell division protein ZapA [Myxococcota bacterium]|nr:cell division protein ZapA [Myxococcota bacterium]